MKAGNCDHLVKSKEAVQEVIKKKPGLRLDHVNSAGGKGGTTANRDRDELIPDVADGNLWFTQKRHFNYGAKKC